MKCMCKVTSCLVDSLAQTTRISKYLCQVHATVEVVSHWVAVKVTPTELPCCCEAGWEGLRHEALHVKVTTPLHPYSNSQHSTVCLHSVDHIASAAKHAKHRIGRRLYCCLVMCIVPGPTAMTWLTSGQCCCPALNGLSASVEGSSKLPSWDR